MMQECTRMTFAQHTIGKAAGVDLSQAQNSDDAWAFLVAAANRSEVREKVILMNANLGNGGDWLKSAQPEQLITRLQSAIEKVTRNP